MQHPLDMPLVGLGRDRRLAFRTRVVIAVAIILTAVAGATYWTSKHTSVLPVSGKWETKRLPELGIQFSYPASWHLQDIDHDLGMTNLTGALISNVDHGFEHPVGHETSAFDMRGLPDTLIVVSFQQMDHLNWEKKQTRGFPLSLDRAVTSNDTIYGLAFGAPQPRYFLGFSVEGHLGSGVQVTIGDVTQEEREAVDLVLASVRPLP